MARLPGDPGRGTAWLLFALGFRLPAENRDWVRHELTDAGWRGTGCAIRHVIVPDLPSAPSCWQLLPGALWFASR